ncbi:TRAP transporter small permease [Marinivivus vitaminiproducens]|uniref:TRAP transporter small permease n=1 Tax=Marinivivus vitaminiproducens TaxID=3035935 RepID=UPI00279DAC97|nr:TRAP transporter small permease [Geminicoccaceae bacterium SCSIO 64248]
MQAILEPARPVSALRRISRFYVRLVEAFAGITMAIIVAVMVVQVAARYLLGGSLIWAEELCRYILIWQTFFVLGLAYSRGEFVVLDILPYLLPRPARLILKLVMAVPILAFLAVIASNGFEYASRFQSQTIPALDFIAQSLTGKPLGLPVTYVYVSVAVGAVLLALHVVAALVGDVIAWRRGEPDVAPSDHGEAI